MSTLQPPSVAHVGDIHHVGLAFIDSRMLLDCIPGLLYAADATAADLAASARRLPNANAAASAAADALHAGREVREGVRSLLLLLATTFAGAGLLQLRGGAALLAAAGALSDAGPDQFAAALRVLHARWRGAAALAALPSGVTAGGAAAEHVLRDLYAGLASQDEGRLTAWGLATTRGAVPMLIDMLKTHVDLVSAMCGTAVADAAGG